MAQVKFPYKPELSEKKAILFSRCFIHCLQDENFKLEEKERDWLIQFIFRVDEKTSLFKAIERLQTKVAERAKTEEEIEDFPQIQNTETIMAQWTIGTLEHFVEVYNEDESKADQVETAQRLLIRKKEQTVQRIRPSQE